MQAAVWRTGLTAGFLILCGCLVSETPVLDASNGNARPFAAGEYISCPVGDTDQECEPFSATIDQTGLYRLIKDGDDPAVLRFRRIGRDGYAVQSREDDDLYQYYYGKGDSQRFVLTMMQCASLPDRLRSRLMERGDLGADDQDYESCTVNTERGLLQSAKAYHRRRAIDEEPVALEFTPAPNNEQVAE